MNQHRRTLLRPARAVDALPFGRTLDARPAGSTSQFDRTQGCQSRGIAAAR